MFVKYIIAVLTLSRYAGQALVTKYEFLVVSILPANVLWVEGSPNACTKVRSEPSNSISDGNYISNMQP